MTLTLATLVFGILLLATGLLLVLNREPWRQACRQFPRSEMAGWVIMGVAGSWFLWHIFHLGEADFGNYRGILFVAFATLGVLSCWHAKDFLAVRAACILYLLAAHVFLDAAFMQEPVTRLFLVTPVYVGIVLALYFTLSPFRVRDFITWLLEEDFRPRLVGGISAAYGVLLILIPLSY